jgi:hypothetical protein
MRTLSVAIIMLVSFTAGLASASSPDDVRRFELALGFTPGQTRVIPALGATIKYLRTQRVSERVFAVYVEKMD